MTNAIEPLEQRQLRDDLPQFKAGDTVRVHFQVIEGQRRRVQVFEGIVIKRQGAGVRETFTVRKQSFGVGVERTFPLHSPKIEKIEVGAIGDVNRAKLYYLRGQGGQEGARPRDPSRTGAVADVPRAVPGSERRPSVDEPAGGQRSRERRRSADEWPSSPAEEPKSAQSASAAPSEAVDEDATGAEAPRVRPQARRALRRRSRRSGRGSLAGPLVVAGVLLDYDALRDHRVRPLALLNDSKQVPPGRAASELFRAVARLRRAIVVRVFPPGEIDRDGLHRSNLARAARGARRR